SQGIKQIDILVDGEAISQADIGISRDDVFANYAALPGAAESGYEGQVDSRQLTNGRHTLEVWVTNTADARTLLADPVTVNVNN
ncbi:MAG: hypothetical protein KC519_16155, partial [Anaerolineae bacterium]|nr:hypothetical protein [Anaerolineae bacterium]